MVPLQGSSSSPANHHHNHQQMPSLVSRLALGLALGWALGWATSPIRPLPDSSRPDPSLSRSWPTQFPGP